MVGAIKNTEVYNKTLLLSQNSNYQRLKCYILTLAYWRLLELTFFAVVQSLCHFFLFIFLHFWCFSFFFEALLLSGIPYYWESESKFGSLRHITIQTWLPIRIEWLFVIINHITFPCFQFHLPYSLLSRDFGENYGLGEIFITLWVYRVTCFIPSWVWL